MNIEGKSSLKEHITKSQTQIGQLTQSCLKAVFENKKEQR